MKLTVEMNNSKPKYEKKRVLKPVSFNKENAQDIERLRKLQQIPDFSNWVKARIDELVSYNQF